MRAYLRPIFLLIILLAILGLSSASPNIKSNSPCIQCDSIPALNRAVVKFVNSVLGKKVNTGQCWDLAEEALNGLGAKWNHLYGFGREIDPTTECIYPGDIVQFEGILIEYAEGNGRVQESMGHHTAIIYSVKNQGEFELAHQNFGPKGKKVGVTNLVLKNIVKGHYSIFRPEK